MTNKLNDAAKAKLTAFVPAEFAIELVDGGLPAVGDVVEMVCVYAEKDDGYGLKFRVKGKDQPRIWVPN